MPAPQIEPVNGEWMLIASGERVHFYLLNDPDQDAGHTTVWLTDATGKVIGHAAASPNTIQATFPGTWSAADKYRLLSSVIADAYPL